MVIGPEQRLPMKGASGHYAAHPLCTENPIRVDNATESPKPAWTSADCITTMSGFDFRWAQGTPTEQRPATRSDAGAVLTPAAGAAAERATPAIRGRWGRLV